MTNYRLEIDALNAIVDEQRRTNELLEKILERGMSNELHQDTKGKNDNSIGSECNVHGGADQDRAVQPNKGIRKHRSRRNA